MQTEEAKTNQELKTEFLFEQLNWRYAVKKFDSTRRLSERQVQDLAEVLRLAPTSYGLQPFKFFIVTNQSVKEKLKPHAWNQPQITDSSHLVVIAAKQDLTQDDVNHYFERIVDVRKMPREQLADFENTVKEFAKNLSSSGNAHNWAARQCYIALGFLLEAAALLKIDACPMEGFVPSGFDEVLKLNEQGYGAVVLCALGFRAEDDAFGKMAKVRFPKHEIIEII
jgi:nitroreductase